MDPATIMALVQGAGQLMSLFSGARAGLHRRDPYAEIPGLRDALAAATASRTYAEAAADPNSAWFKNLAALFKEAQVNSAIQGIGRLQSRQAQLRARGAPGILTNPDRRDEAISKTIADAFAKADLASREQAQSALLRASGAAGNAAGAFAGPMKLFRTYGDIEDERRKNMGNMWNSAGEGAKQLFGSFDSLFGGGGSPTISGPTATMGSGSGSLGYYPNLGWMGP